MVFLASRFPSIIPVMTSFIFCYFPFYIIIIVIVVVVVIIIVIIIIIIIIIVVVVIIIIVINFRLRHKLITTDTAAIVI